MPHSRSLLLAAAALLAASCQAPTLIPGAGAEKTVSANAWGNVVLKVDGRTFSVRAAGGEPLSHMSVKVGRQRYPVEDGTLALPAAALQQAKTNHQGFFLVLAQGYSAKQVWIGQADDEIVLTPVRALTILPSLGPSGGKLVSPEGGLAVEIPQGALAAEQTPAALSDYVPALAEEEATALRDQREDAASKLLALGPAKGSGIIAAGGGNFRTLEAEACALPGVLPCDPYTGLGLLVTVDGPLKGGKLQVAVDLNALLKGLPLPELKGYGLADAEDAGSPFAIPPGIAKQSPSKIAAWRLRKTLEMLDGYNPAWKSVLLSDGDVTIDGSVIRFSVDLSAAATGDEHMRVHVKALDTLMTRVEVTVASTASTRGAALPIEASLPDLIALAPARFVPEGTPLISADTANLISDKGMGVISGNGASVIANNGGGLTGRVRTPFFADSVKYNLLGLVEYNWPYDGRVREVSEEGQALSGWVALDSEGRFALSKPEGVAEVVFLEAEAGDQRLRTSAVLPPEGVTVSTDITTSSTCITSSVRHSVVRGDFGVEDIDVGGGFRQDVQAINERLDEALARKVMRSNIPTIAELTEALIGQPTAVSAPTLKGVTVRVEQMPAGAADLLAAVTGLPAGALRPGANVPADQGVSFSDGRLSIRHRGFQADGPVPEGPLRLRYTVSVERGSGRLADYQFVFGVTNFALLGSGATALPLDVSLLEPRRTPGALLGNYWSYAGR